jgi:hypothetical protein
VSEDWKQVEEQLSLLAKEAVQSPQILTSDLTQWLLTASHKKLEAFSMPSAKRITPIISKKRLRVSARMPWKQSVCPLFCRLG